MNSHRSLSQATNLGSSSLSIPPTAIGAYGQGWDSRGSDMVVEASVVVLMFRIVAKRDAAG